MVKRVSNELQRSKDNHDRDHVLGLADISKPFEKLIDASHFVLGGVLFEERHRIAYESNKLNNAERKYTFSGKEMFVGNISWDPTS